MRISWFVGFTFVVFLALAIRPQGVLAEDAPAAATAGESHEAELLNFFDFEAEESHPLAALLFNFAALVAIVYLLMKKPLGNRFRARKAELEKALEEARAAKEQAEAAIEAARTRAATIEAEMTKLHDEIVAAGEKERAAIIARAEAEANRLLADTETLVAHEISILTQNLKTEIVEEIIEKATEEIRRQISEADHARLAADYLGRIKAAAEAHAKH